MHFERAPWGGRPKKGEVVEKKEPRRIERQAAMSLAEMLADLPTHCAVGTKRNAKGHTISWIGYKLHLDIADFGRYGATPSPSPEGG